MSIHSQQTISQGIHTAIAYEFADAAARTANGAYYARDRGKLAWQLDDNTFWVLLSIASPGPSATPTWLGVLKDGDDGEDGIDGADGLTGFGLRLIYSVALTTPPNTGELRMNSATYSAVTEIYVSETDRNSVAISDILGEVTPGSTIALIDESDSTAYVYYKVTGQTDSGTYRTFTVTFRGAGPGTLAGDVSLTFANKGEQGATGSVSSASSLNLAHIATPSPPSAGNVLVYVKSDNKLYRQTSAGAETEVGSGGGHTIQNDGTAQTQRANLNLKGFKVTDDSSNNATVIQIAETLTDKALYYYDLTTKTLKPIPIGTVDQVLVAKPSLDPPYQFATPSGGSGGRELLTSNRTYYVRTDGSDSNNGLANTAGGAFLTIQKAIDTVCSIDLSIYDCTIQIADGTYNAKVRLKNYISSGGKAFIRGNASAIGNVILDYTASSGAADANLEADSVLSTWYVGNFTFASTATNRFSTRIANGSSLVVDAPVRFQATAGGTHLFLENNGRIFVPSNYEIAGGAGNHIFARVNSTFIVSGSFPITVTLTGTPAFSSNFINAQRKSIVDYWGFTASGSATGTRYFSQGNSVIFTNGTTLPGNVDGSIASGGQYL